MLIYYPQIKCCETVFARPSIVDTLRLMASVRDIASTRVDIESFRSFSRAFHTHTYICVCVCGICQYSTRDVHPVYDLYRRVQLLDTKSRGKKKKKNIVSFAARRVCAQQQKSAHARSKTCVTEYLFVSLAIYARRLLI